jgi:hypothetical protein
MFSRCLVQWRSDGNFAMMAVESVGARVGAYDWNETFGGYMVY